MSEQDAALDLSEAEAALERGDYGQGLELLLPLAEQHPLNSPEGPGLRLLMITAWMGQGQKQLQALAVVPALQGCLRFREVQCCVLLAHPLAASHHHGSDAGVGEDFEQEGMGNPAINDVGG